MESEGGKRAASIPKKMKSVDGSVEEYRASGASGQAGAATSSTLKPTLSSAGDCFCFYGFPIPPHLFFFSFQLFCSFFHVRSSNPRSRRKHHPPPPLTPPHPLRAVCMPSSFHRETGSAVYQQLKAAVALNACCSLSAGVRSTKRRKNLAKMFA